MYFCLNLCWHFVITLQEQLRKTSQIVYYASYKDSKLKLSDSQTQKYGKLRAILLLTCLWKRMESAQIKQSLPTLGRWPLPSGQQFRQVLSPFLFSNEPREKFLHTGKDWSKLPNYSSRRMELGIWYLYHICLLHSLSKGSVSTLSLCYSYPSLSLSVWCCDQHCFPSNFRYQHLRSCNNT